MSQVSIVDIEHNNPQIPTRFNANVGFAIPIANVLEIYGGTVAAGTVPVSTIGSGNNITTNVQLTQAIAATDATRVGLAAFNSSDFSVDANGFVSITATFAETITGDTGGALSPVAGNWNIVGGTGAAGTVPVSTSGAGNTLTVNVQRSQAFASSVAARAGIASFDSTKFTVDANGYVSVSGTGVGQTITGTTGGALSPVAGNWNIIAAVVAASTTSIATSGSGNTLTINIQRSQAFASSVATRAGIASFDSAVFTVDTNAFVSVSGTAVGRTITGNSGGARSPTAGNWNIITANATPTFVGASSTLTLDFNITNLVLGSSLPSVTSGGQNVGVGQATLSAITSGSSNVGFGYHALDACSSGQSNTAIGQDALGAVSTMNNNTAVGRAALMSYNGQNSTAIGYGALQTNVSGDDNVAVGFSSLQNSTGSHNTAIGYNSGVGLVGGEQNVVVGAQAFVSAISSNYCTAVGYQALNACTGSDNTAIGRAALVMLQNANDNTAIGYNSIFGATTGSNNSAVGSSTLTQVLTGSNNIAIGYLAGNSLTGSDSSNVCIGHVGVAGNNNKIRIGTQGTGAGQQDECYIAGQLNGSSGRSYKITIPGAYPYTTVKEDYVVMVNSSTTAKTINLIAVPVNNPYYIIKDSNGNAGANNITISGNGNTIDGAASVTINSNYGVVRLVWNGTQWSVI